MEKQKLSAEVKVRLADEEKTKLKQLADDANLTMSELVRSIIFCQEKLVFLVEGADIAESLFAIRKDVQALRNENLIPTSQIDKVQDALDKVSTQLCALSEQLSDVSTIEEGYNDD